MLLATIFYHVDNFCKDLDDLLAITGLIAQVKRGPACSLLESEIMTILICFYHSGKRHFKDYSQAYIKGFISRAFPSAPSYNRFIELVPSCMMPLYIFMNYCRFGTVTGIPFINSTSLPVCLNLRIRSNKVFKGLAA